MKPIVVKRPGQFQVTESECVVTPEWGAALKKDLIELGQRAATDSKRYAIYLEVEAPLSDQIKNAHTLSECASVQKKMRPSA